MNVSILVIAPKSNETTKKSLEILNKQKYSGKKEIIVVSEPLGLAENMNFGIRKAKYEVIVTLHHDCIPSSLSWLENLVAPLKKKEFVATCSKVKLPDEIWNNLGIFTKAMMLKERRIITPLLDEKGCAYKREALEKIGLFEGKKFKIAGEDFNTYIKLKKIGKIGYPDATVLHYHPSTLKDRVRKEGYVWGMGDGANIRINGLKMPGWQSRIMKAIPFLGLVVFAARFPFGNGLRYYPFYLVVIPAIHLLYSVGFWKGLIRGKQTI